MPKLNLNEMTSRLHPVAHDCNTEWSAVNLCSSLTWLIHAAQLTKYYASDLFITHREIIDAMQRVDVDHDEWVLAGFRDRGIDPRSWVEHRLWNSTDKYHVLAAIHIYMDGWRHVVEVFNLTAVDRQWVFEEEPDDNQ